MPGSLLFSEWPRAARATYHARDATLNGPWGFHYIGPWLRPAFAMKRIAKTDMEQSLTTLVDAFARMLVRLNDPANGIYHIDLRGLLARLYGSGADGYKEAWANELHPTNRGFDLIADQFSAAILKALP